MPRSANRRVALVAAAVTAAAGAVLAQQTPPSFVARTDVVLVDVQVTRSGRPVEGLTASDFVVRDSGVPQTSQLVSADNVPVDLLLALDTSASVRGDSLDRLKEAARAAASSLRPGDRGGLLTFSHAIRLRAAWTTDREALGAAIAGVTAEGSTSLTDAAFAALAMHAEPGRRVLVLVFTDGDDTASWLSAHDVLQAARRSEAVVYGVTLEGQPGHSGADVTKILREPGPAGDRARRDAETWLAGQPSLYRGALLPLLAFETGGESFSAAGAAKLGDAFVEIMARFGRRYLLAYTPTGVPQGGWHPLEVTVKNGGDVIARRGYVR